MSSWGHGSPVIRKNGRRVIRAHHNQRRRSKLHDYFTTNIEVTIHAIICTVRYSAQDTTCLLEIGKRYLLDMRRSACMET
jgi:hypothetical protein